MNWRCRFALYKKPKNEQKILNKVYSRLLKLFAHEDCIYWVIPQKYKKNDIVEHSLNPLLKYACFYVFCQNFERRQAVLQFDVLIQKLHYFYADDTLYKATYNDWVVEQLNQEKLWFEKMMLEEQLPKKISQRQRKTL